MRQAYDYWQDQPDNYVVGLPAPKPSPPRTGRSSQNTFKPYKLFIWLQTHCCVRGTSARPPVFYHSKQTVPHPYSPLKILPVWCPCDCDTTRTAAHVEHRQPWRELHSAKSQILLRLLAKAYPESVLVFNTCYQLVIH